MVYKEQLVRIRKEMAERCEALVSESEHIPAKGYLVIARRDGKSYYYEHLPVAGNSKKVHRKGISKDKDRILMLVRKKYLGQAISNLKKDIDSLDRLIKEYTETDEISVMKDFIEMHPELEAGLFYGRQSDEDWAKDYAAQSNYRKKGLKQTYATGTKMRSKSELIIASRLEKFHIPFRYENKLNEVDVDRIPDFTIRRPRDGKIIYWEHVGMSGNEGYMSGFAQRMAEYENIDIVPWDNLIITYDQEGNSIDVRIIDGLIQGWLL